jgi:hypothetical protein
MRSNPNQTADAGQSAGSRLRRSTWVALTGAALILTASCGPYRSPSAATEAAAKAEADVARVLQTVWAGLGEGDPEPVLATFAHDVQLHSPALMDAEYRGRALVASIVTPAMQVLGKARVTHVLRAGDGTTGSVVFETRIGNEPTQGVVMVRMRGEQIGEITLLLRPLPALRAFVTRMAELGAKPALDAGQG